MKGPTSFTKILCIISLCNDLLSTVLIYMMDNINITDITASNVLGS
jgi:hypothetical protein